MPGLTEEEEEPSRVPALGNVNTDTAGDPKESLNEKRKDPSPTCVCDYIMHHLLLLLLFLCVSIS